jgi:hypothetical protein
LFSLFETSAITFQFLKRHVQFNKPQAVRDACLFNVPSDDKKWDKKKWAKLAMAFGAGITPYIELAPKIEAHLQNTHPTQQLNSQAQFKLIKEIVLAIQYKNRDKHLALAKLCFSHKQSEDIYEMCLDIVNRGLKTFDFLPTIDIAGKDLNPQLARFRFTKLPAGDLRGFFLGEYTGCCQSIGSVGHHYTYHGMTSLWAGFYVVYDDKDKIIAQSWAWIGEGRAVVFDSWEFIDKTQAFLCRLFLEKAAEKILQQGFSRVLIGTGGHTPQETGFVITSFPAKIIGYKDDSDAEKQLLISAVTIDEERARFQVYAAKQSISFNDYQYLIEMNKRKIAPALLDLIKQNIPVQTFKKLCDYFLASIDEHIYHAQNNDPSFIKTALDHNINGQTTNIEYFYDYLLVSQEREKLLCRTYVAELIHAALREDSTKILIYLYDYFNQHETWQEFLMRHTKDASILFLAARLKAIQCTNFMIDQINDNKYLFDCLNERKHNTTMLHLLTQHDALDLIEKLIYPISDENRLQLLETRAKLSYHNNTTWVSVYFYALYYQNNTVFQYFMAHDNVKPALRRDVTNLLNDIVCNNDASLLKKILALNLTDTTWQLNYNVLLAIAFQGHAVDCLLILLNHINDFNTLHQALIKTEHKSFYSHLLNYFDHIQSQEEAHLIIEKLLSYYRARPIQLGETIINDDLPFFCALVTQHNIKDFDEILACLSKDKGVFGRLTTRASKYKDTILDVIIKMCDEFPIEENRPLTPIHITTAFIDTVLKYCSREQCEQLFNSTHYYLMSCCPDTLNYLIEKILSTCGETFLKKWMLNDNNNPLVDCIKNRNYEYCLQNSHSMLKHYYTYLGEKEVNQLILSNIDNIIFYLSVCDNVFMVEKIFSLIKDDKIAILTLFDNLSISSSKMALQWLLQHVKTGSIIKEAFEQYLTHIIKRITVQRGCGYDCSHMFIMEIYWQACVKHLFTGELFIFSMDLCLKIKKALYNATVSCLKKEFVTLKFALHQTLSWLRQYHVSPLFLLSTTTSDDYDERRLPVNLSLNWDILNILLFNSQLSEQVKVLNYFYTLPIANDFENKKQIENIGQYHRDLTRLRELANTMSRDYASPDKTNLCLFSSKQPNKHGISSVINENNLLSFDENNTTQVTLLNSSIIKAWQNKLSSYHPLKDHYKGKKSEKSDHTIRGKILANLKRSKSDSILVTKNKSTNEIQRTSTGQQKPIKK